MSRILILLVVFFLFAQRSVGRNEANGKEKPIRILFVGNSLTYVNDLPHLVEQVARERGVSIKTEMLAFPDYALEDHWKEG